jgi:hypothetical protein
MTKIYKAIFLSSTMLVLPLFAAAEPATNSNPAGSKNSAPATPTQQNAPDDDALTELPDIEDGDEDEDSDLD